MEEPMAQANGGRRCCRIYEARVAGHPEYDRRILVLADEEPRLRENILSGRSLFHLGRLVGETGDPDAARRMLRNRAE